MNKYAILIGNAKFPNESSLPDLRCPALDVEGLAKVLESPERGEFEVMALKDQPRDEVEHSLNRMLNKAGRNDLALIYYSGHGKQSKSGQLYLTSLNTEVEVLNTTAVGLTKVYELINDSSCRKIILILDCCYSGAAGAAFKGDISSELKQVNSKSRGTYLITASTEIEVAQEKSEDDYSLFTKHLIEGLESGAADKNGDGVITIDELYQYVHDKVLDENPNQQPTKTSKGERGELIIAKSGRNSREDLVKKIRRRLVELTQEDDEFFAVSAEAVSLFKVSVPQLSSIQRQRYALLESLVNKPLSPISFIRSWDRLNPSSLIEVENRDEIERKKINKLSKDIYTHKQVFRDKLKNGQDAPEMVYLQSGKFLMGSPSEVKKSLFISKTVIDDGQGYKDEIPQHEVMVKNFAIGKYAVTFAEYDLFCKLTQKEKPDDKNWGRDKRPVINVSWLDAAAYCEWLSQETGKTYRLATEAEWEYACRAGTTTRYFFGDDDADLSKYAWYDGNSNSQTHPVGEKLANAFGLYDMAGNVWEWTGSKFDSNYNENENKYLSKNNAQNDSLVIRSGSWSNKPGWLRSPARNGGGVADRDSDLGFRISRTR